MSSIVPQHLSPEVKVRQTGGDRTFLVASVPAGAGAAGAASAAYAQIGEALREREMEIVHERVFGGLEVEAAVRAARGEALGACGVACDGPVSYLAGRPAGGEGLAGVIVHAVAAAEERARPLTILDNGIPCGRAWRRGEATFLVLQNVQGVWPGEGGDNTPAAQARRAIQRADRILREHGASFCKTVRTWFYLDNILEWYGEFNEVRNAMYGEFGLVPRAGQRSRLPASTGIRAELPGGVACSLDLLAVAGPEGAARVEYVSNPCQPEALQYGSAFSRCVVIPAGRGRLVEVSGTAAIDERGRSQYPGDVRAQVGCTLEKVAALLRQVEASVADISAATLFVKRGADAEKVREAITEAGLEGLPAVCVVADVCREELLFEIDAEAVVSR